MQNLTAVIPYYNGGQYIDNLLASLPDSLPVLIIDDLSSPPLDDGFVSRYPDRDMRVLRPVNKGYFAGAVNVALNALKTDVLILNQDVSFEDGAQAALSLIAKARSKFAVIGDGVFGHPAWPMGYVQGTFMFMRRDAIDEIGLFDSVRFPLWGCTAEWQARACRKGFYALPMKDVPNMRHERGESEYGDGIANVLDGADRSQRDLLIRTPPLVSVIVTSYNYGRYLEDAVNSLVGGHTSLGDMPGQTVQSFEVIIVNDASQDETAEIGQALADPWKGVRYIELEPSNHADGLPNNGTPAANNAGIRAAYGRFIAILCADDMYDPRRLETLLPVLEKNPRAVAYDDMMMFAYGQYTRQRSMEEYDFERLIHRNQFHAGILFHKNAWRDVGEYPEVMRYGREDWAINVAFGAKGYCGVRVNYPGYLYRREDQGRTARNGTGKWRARFVDQMKGLFPLIYSGVRPMGCCGGGNKMRNSGKIVSKLGVAGTIPDGFVGKDGMVVIEYLGKNQGTQSWPGESGQRYEFGMGRKAGYVSAADAAYMIRQYWDGNLPLFRVAEPVKTAGEAVVTKGVAAEVNPPLPPALPAAPPALPSDEQEPVPNPADFSVKALKAHLTEYSLPKRVLAKMLRFEQEGSKRGTAITALEDALGKAD